MTTDPTSPTPQPPQDSLADFIAKRRADFDEAPAPHHIWIALEAELNEAAFAKTASAPLAPVPSQPNNHPTEQPNNRRAHVITLYPYWRKLAVACMLLVIGGLSGFLIAERFGESREGSNLAIYSKRTQQLEANYQREIDQRIAQLTALGADSALQAEMVSLSQPEYVLQEDLVQLGTSSEQLVIEVMAQEYKAKLEALEHVLTRLRAAERPRQRPNLNPAPPPADSPRLQNL